MPGAVIIGSTNRRRYESPELAHGGIRPVGAGSLQHARQCLRGTASLRSVAGPCTIGDLGGRAFVKQVQNLPVLGYK